jgi:hypothetical protein
MRLLKTANDVLEFILEIENKFEPQGWRFNDIDIWPILRVSIYYELSLSLDGFNMPKSTTLKKIKRLAAISLPHTYQLKKNIQLLLVSDGISYISLNKKLYERFCDPFIEIAIDFKRHLNWEKWDLANNLKGNFNFNPIKIAGIIDFILLKSKFYQNKVKINNEKKIESFCVYLNQETKNRINWSLQKIKSKLVSFEILVDYFQDLLSLNKPKLVIIVGYYSDRAMSLICACSRLQIKTADIQHGVQGQYHAAYANWQCIPNKGYNTLPNDFLVWSINDKKNIDHWSHIINYHQAVVLSNVFQEKWYKNNDSLVNNLDEKIKKIIAKMIAKDTVLFTLQYGITYENWVYKLIYETQNNFNWLIRLHPIMQDNASVLLVKQKLKSYGISNYELDKSSSLPLYSLLRNINLHITHSSSTVLEAIDFQIKSIILSNYGSEFFADQINQNNAILISNNDKDSMDLMQSFKKLSYNHRSDYCDSDTTQKSEEFVLEYLQKNL